MTEIVPLGTGSALPTRTRGLAAWALRRGGRLLLFDCGEGTQRRLLEAGLSHGRLDAVFLTHFHGDHLFGLFGLLTTLALLNRDQPLTLVSPAGLEAILAAVPGLHPDDFPFPLRLVALEEGFGHAVVYEDEAATVEARPLEHRGFTAGYRYAERTRPGKVDGERARAAGVREGWQFEALKRREPVALADGTVLDPAAFVGPERPGAVFAYVSDTRPVEGGRLLAGGADVLVHEATFTDDLAARAAETGHSTARQAAEVARDAGARRLLLTHFSARFSDAAPLVDEARAIFPNTDAAEELRRYALVRAP